MERKVLHWLSQVPLIRELDEACEIVAQFEIGKYLRQLDDAYRHPDYRADFLVRFTVGDKLHQLVLEYDGFEFHFAKGMPAGLINQSTWRSYLTAADVEREKVLEGFGVQMIRLNRFNLGSDPVATIDELLRKRLGGVLNGRKPHPKVTADAKRAGEIEKGLKSGEYKHCKGCDRDLPLSWFLVPTLKTGIAHLCADCRSKGSPRPPSFRLRRYRRWR
jgi:hypothetical protein